jgi:hypothetical protein
MEGQVKILAASNDIQDLATMQSIVWRVCTSVGNTRRVLPVTEEAPFLFRVEFDSVDAANRAVEFLQVSPGWQLNEKEVSLSTDLNAFTC